jgi:hypothetical protein
MYNFLINDPRCVFIHIPKTGGASIRRGFFEGKHDKKAKGKIPFLWRRYYKFAFVRDPYTRFLSCYKMFRWGMERTKWVGFEREDLTLERFIAIAGDESIDVWNRKTFEGKLRHHAVPQTHPDNCLREADFVGRFENLREDFAKVCAHLGIEGQLPHLNKSVSERQQTVELTDEAIAFIRAFYAEDFARLGYDPDAIPGRKAGKA